MSGMDAGETGWHVCTQCGEIFERQLELTSHECSPEDNDVNSSTSAAMKSNTRACPLCLGATAFEEKFQLFGHLLESHSVDSIFECSRCDDIFIDRAALSAHLGSHEETGTELKTMESTPISSVMEFHCEICPRDFKSLSAYRRHQAWHAGPQLCTDCNKTFRSPVNLKYHVCEGNIKTLNREKYECPKCAKSFTFQSYLDRHLTTHSGGPISCNFCNLIFTVESTYIRHCKTVHSGKSGKFPCHECGKSFLYQSHLDRHKLKHTKEKKFECPSCFQRFALPHGLKSHQLRFHSSEMPANCSSSGDKKQRKTRKFPCPFCTASFSCESLLEQHHHAEHQHLCPPLTTEMLTALGENKQRTPPE